MELSQREVERLGIQALDGDVQILLERARYGVVERQLDERARRADTLRPSDTRGPERLLDQVGEPRAGQILRR